MRLQPAEEPTRYVLTTVERGTLVTSISGSGQVSDENSIAMQPSVSDAVTAVHIKSGDEVKSGDLLVELDASDAQKTVRDASQSVYDARLSLDAALISLQRLQQTDPESILRAENTLKQAERTLDDLKTTDSAAIHQAELDLEIKENAAKLSSDGRTPQSVRDAMDDAIADLSAAYRAFHYALRDADGILAVDGSLVNENLRPVLSVMDSGALSEAQWAYQRSATKVDAFNDALATIPSIQNDENAVKALTEKGAAIARELRSMLELTQDVLANTISSASLSQSSLDGLRNSIASTRSAMESQHNTLESDVDAIDDAWDAYANALLAVEKARDTLSDLRNGADLSDILAAEERVSEARASLDALRDGPDALDLASAQNSVAQRRSTLTSASNRLADAREMLADYAIRAPVDGTVGAISAKVGGQVSPSTSLLTLLTPGLVAELSVNEVDAVTLKVGQKATLTFDAIEDLTIAGTVSRVDAVGTVQQGVVSYGVAIAFDTEDERVKPGMTVSANIVTTAKTDVLLVPASAVQTATNGAAFVQTLQNVNEEDNLSQMGVASDMPPSMLPVQIGASNDQFIEITDGLAEGDYVITRTIQPSAGTTAAANAPTQGFGIGGVGGGGFGGGGFGGGARAFPR